MKGIIKGIRNGIFIHKMECRIPTIGIHTVAELFNGDLVDLTDISENYFGKITIKKKVLRRLNRLKRGQFIEYYYNEELGLNIPVPGTFSLQ